MAPWRMAPIRSSYRWGKIAAVCFAPLPRSRHDHSYLEAFQCIQHLTLLTESTENVLKLRVLCNCRVRFHSLGDRGAALSMPLLRKSRGNGDDE